jgi:hypothetical protein
MVLQDRFDRYLQASLELLQDPAETVESVLARYPPEIAEQLQPLLEAALWVKQSRSLYEPRPGFVASSKQRLLAQIRQEAATGRVATPSPSFLTWVAGLFASRQMVARMAFAAIFLVFMLVGSSGIALASQNSLPGDTLYPVKIGLEQAALAVTTNSVDNTRLHIQFAQRRLLEIQSLALEGRYEQIPETVDGFEVQVNQAISDLDHLTADGIDEHRGAATTLAQSLNDTLREQVGIVGVLANSAPEPAKPDLERALRAGSGQRSN